MTPDTRPNGETVSPCVDTALLTALAQGGIDPLVARRMGVSTRTFRRRMAALMRALGATNRFQAGARAAQTGMLPPEPPQQWRRGR